DLRQRRGLDALVELGRRLRHDHDLLGRSCGLGLRIRPIVDRLRVVSEVVGGRHVLGRPLRPAAVELAEREADPAPGAVGAQHHDLDLLADLEDVLGALDVVPGELADVQQPLDPVGDLEEGTVLLGLGDLAVDDFAGREAVLDRVPRVIAKLAQRETDAGELGVELDDLDPDLVPDGQHVRHVVDAVPGQLADVDQTVGAAEVDEGAVAGQAAHLAGDHVADLELLEQLLALACPVLVLRGTLGDDEPVALAVDLEDLDGDLGPHQLHQVAGELARHLTGGQEAAQPHDVDDQAALVLLADLGIEDLALRLLLGDRLPDRLGAGLAEREDDPPLLVLGLEDVHLDSLTRYQDHRGLVAAGELPVGDHSLRLGPDVDQHLIGIDPHHDAFDDVAIAKGLDVALLLAEKFLHGERLALRCFDAGGQLSPSVSLAVHLGGSVLPRDLGPGARNGVAWRRRTGAFAPLPCDTGSLTGYRDRTERGDATRPRGADAGLRPVTAQPSDR